MVRFDEVEKTLAVVADMCWNEEEELAQETIWSVVDARNVYTSRLCCRAFRSLEGARKNDANLDILFFLPWNIRKLRKKIRQ
jgi:hypothetical protein